MPLLEIKDLSVRFGGGKPVVDSASFSVEVGSFTALVGESGSGKSMTALSVCRLVRGARTAGSVLWAPAGAPRDLLSLPEEELRRVRGGEIGYVFQDPASSLNPLARVGDQIREAWLAHRGTSLREAGERAMRFLEAARIGDAERVYKSYPHELSGGMKQRAMIAMALIAEPRLLIADEPTTALDVTTEAEILKLLADIRVEKSLTVLFITHDLPLAAKVAGRIVVMEKGRVVERMDKSGAEGFRPAQAYTKKLFGVDLARSTPKRPIGV